MIRAAPGWSAALLFAIAANGPVSGAQDEYFWVPALSLDVGAEEHRQQEFSDVAESGSASYVEAGTALGLHALAEGAWEASVDLRARQRSYADVGGMTRAYSAEATAWRTGVSSEQGATIDLEWFEDDAMPSADRLWIGIAPSALWYIGATPWVVTAGGRLGSLTYPHVDTEDGTSLRGTFVEVRPGVRWIASPDTSCWAELFGQSEMFDEPEEDALGYGVAAGLTLRLGPRMRVALRGEAGRREHPEGDGDVAWTQEPRSLGIEGSYRWKPWLEVRAHVAYLADPDGTEPQDGEGWSGGLGVVLTDELPWSSR